MAAASHTAAPPCPVGSSCCQRHPRACTPLPRAAAAATKHTPAASHTIEYHANSSFVAPLPLDQDCRSCRRAIDVRCLYARRTATHHRVIDCLAPLYGGMATQLQTWRREHADDPMCLVGESDVMYGFARALLPPLANLRYVAADNRTTFPLRPHCASLPIPPTQRWRVHEEPDHENLCTGTSVARTCRVLHPGEASRELHGDVKAMLRRRGEDEEQRHVLLIARNRSSFRGRAFDAHEEQRLASRLSVASGGRRTILYTGGTSLPEMISLFARADAIVGIHGAGLTNAIFTPHRVCVVEISSWTDKQRKAKWRTSGDYGGRTDSSVPRWSRHIDWHVHRLAPEQIVASLSPSDQKKFWSDAPDPRYLNEKAEPVKPNRKRDIMLLDAPIFRLTPSDMDAISRTVVGCTAHNQGQGGGGGVPAGDRPHLTSALSA